MEPKEIFEKVQARFAEAAIELQEEGFRPAFLVVAPEKVKEIGRFLRDDPEMKFDSLMCLSGVDYPDRFAVAYHLLSVKNNHRVRLKVFASGEVPLVDSVIPVWSSANWFEREAFDLFGIVFEGHPDLRRILTDYGFVGHPFRKDFPLSGNVEMRYDPEKGRVVYQPVSIEARNMVPRVIREDHRYVTPELPPSQGEK